MRRALLPIVDRILVSRETDLVGDNLAADRILTIGIQAGAIG